MLPPFGVEVFLRVGMPFASDAGVLLRVIDVTGKQVKLHATGPAGTLVVKSRHRQTGHLVLTLAGGQEYPPQVTKHE
jgi:hypothetical protein